MHIQEALGRFLQQMEADGRSPHTLKQYARHVGAFMDWVGPDTDADRIGHEQVADFLVAQMPERKPSTVNVMRSSIRCFFRYLHDADVITRNPAALVRRARCGAPRPRGLSGAEVAKLESILATRAPRERLLLNLMLLMGLRVGSVVVLDVKDLDFVNQEIHLRHAKGDQDEVLPMPRALLDELEPWIGDQTEGPLFPRVGVRHAQRLFQEIAKEAGLPHLTCHSLRHTFATNLYRRTGDIRLVQRALCHRSIESTLVYAHADISQLRAVMGA